MISFYFLFKVIGNVYKTLQTENKTCNREFEKCPFPLMISTDLLLSDAE